MLWRRFLINTKIKIVYCPLFGQEPSMTVAYNEIQGPKLYFSNMHTVDKHHLLMKKLPILEKLFGKVEAHLF